MKIDDLIKAQSAQLEADRKLAAASAAKAAADRRLAEVAAYFAANTKTGVFYEVSPEYFLQKVSETNVQLIPRQTLSIEPPPKAPTDGGGI